MIVLLGLIFAWVYRFFPYFKHATTQDFANFGTYIGGILTPLFTFLSAMAIVYQIKKSSDSQKLDRILADYKETLQKLDDELFNIDEKELRTLRVNARSLWKQTIEDPNNTRHFYRLRQEEIRSHESIAKALRLTQLMTVTLPDIEEYDPSQHIISINAIYRHTDPQVINDLELINFFIYSRLGTPANEYKWINPQLAENLVIQEKVTTLGKKSESVLEEQE